MIDDTDQLLFLVYNMLRKKFEQQSEELKEEPTHNLDHLREQQTNQRYDDHAAKNAYIHELLAQLEAAKRPQVRPLDPVRENYGIKRLYP